MSVTHCAAPSTEIIASEEILLCALVLFSCMLHIILQTGTCQSVSAHVIHRSEQFGFYGAIVSHLNVIISYLLGKNKSR